MNYKNLFDNKLQFIRAKLADGHWADPFDPVAMGHSKKWSDYREANSWQTTFGIQHDPYGLIELFGGDEAFVLKLDQLFNQSSSLPQDAPHDIAGLVGQYAHGNEPCHHVAYLYTYAGYPHKTQERVRSLLESMYQNEPDGLAGNEDCGQMSAWFVLSSLGLYPVDPVSGNYVFAAPLYDRAVIRLTGGRQLIVEVLRDHDRDIYIQQIHFNGKSHRRLWIAHSELTQGGKLVFRMGSSPSREFAGYERPPRFISK